MSAAFLQARFWFLTAVALAGLLCTASLGVWQLSRATQKLDLQSAIDTRQQLAALDGDTLLRGAASPDAVHRRVVLRGSWLGTHTIFLDNRQMLGKPGFFVLTPLRLENQTATVLVQRGWVPRNFADRTQVPVVDSPGGIVRIEGRIAPPPSKLYEFAGPDTGVIRQNLDMQRFAGEIGVALLPISVLQTGVGADSMLRDWPRMQTGVEKHYGYAFQWFALSGLIAFLYVWFQLVRRPAG